ncbi:sigma-54 interaction domain-containing protein [Cytobacillus purgationiresistens]|uniref:HTH-type transcriptional regulatory protein TyrR n=1 Tax=Cytobacillus purgationiresistens TaxID=863449 RepID=A0ABU0AGP1_9BACI|nr:sigma 54-interacting transcriptional regulator [Cytobacillus purgationiresistens]MDQ0270419.1 PAS domain S-box-containing protein [Cytobacillus purgationiresistens]
MTLQLQTAYAIMMTDDEDIIIEVNDKLKQSVNKNLENHHVNEVFKRWIPYEDGKVVIAEATEELSLLFLKGESQLNRNLYFGIISSEMKELMVKLDELIKANSRLQAIIESSYDGIYLTDIEGNTLLTNSAMERITGIPKEYYMGKKVESLIKRGILESSVTKRVIETKESISRVQFNRAGNESLLLTGSPVFNEKREVESVVTNIRDLSQLIELQNALKEANELNHSYRKEIERLKKKENEQSSSIIMKSEKMREIYDTVDRLVNVDATVLVLGETGVGKDVLAKYIYEHSDRNRKGKYIKLNCGAIPSELIESELFGYEKGAFTGAGQQGKPGMFELADQGVLFLDEVGELPLSAQVKLLRVIQEKEVQRIGAVAAQQINVRLIAATNRNLKSMVDEGLFREDLYYRLNVIPIHIPRLSERPKDIHPLLEYFLAKNNQKYNFQKQFSEELKSFFHQHSWPGNIRELSNLVERLLLVSKETIITLKDLPQEYQLAIHSVNLPPESLTLKEAIELAEKQVICHAMKTCTSTYELATKLETSQPTISRKLKKYGLHMIQ